MKITYFVNNASFFVSHRLSLGLEATNQGHEISILTGLPGSDELEFKALQKLRGLGIKHDRVAITPSGVNPIKEAYGFFEALKNIRWLSPDLMHCVSPKGVIYGGAIARLLKVPSLVLAISGMGSLFTRGKDQKNLLYWFLSKSYLTILMWILGHKNLRVIVQNLDDKLFLIKQCKFDANKITLIHGSGVNLDEFIHYPIASKSKTVVFPARLLSTKGVMEFIEAARQIKNIHQDWRFLLVGDADYDNPGIISPMYLQEIVDCGSVEWLGHVEKIAPILGDARIVCLPSYREGMPKALLEGAAAGCAIVTTNAIGCKEAIIPGVTGDLVPVANVAELVDCLLSLMSDAQRCAKYGFAGRGLAIEQFGIEKVVVKTLQIYEELSSHE